MDATDVALIRKTFEGALATAAGDVTALLGDLGWGELHAVEPAVAVGELFDAQGRLGSTTNALDIVVASVLGSSLPEGTAVVHPSLGGWDRPPGHADASGALRVDGLVLAGAERAARFLVAVEGVDGRLEAITVDAADAHVRPIDGLDPSLQLAAVAGSTTGFDHDLLVAATGQVDGRTGAAAAPGCHWRTVALSARRALAHELCGLGQVMLDTAAAYVTDRHQFGRPIAAFQTVRHRLTEVFVALASARAALDAGWATGDPLLADAAKALAGRAGHLAARHCLQVTGAIGFTEEYALAARMRRVALLDALYGTADQLRSRLGAQLLAEGSVPRLHALS